MKHFSSLSLAAILSLSAPAIAADWDVTNTGQPSTELAFTVTEGTWLGLDVSPDGKTIVFDLLGDIYRIPAEGGDAVLVHGGPAMQRAARFSRDGKRLVYVSDASGSDNLWVSNADGSQPRRVTSETADQLTGPAWAADGSYLVAAKMISDVANLHSSELRLFDIAGGAGRVLVETPKETNENVHEAQLSRDGQYLYYTEKVTPPSASNVYIDANHANYAIKRRDLKTGATEEIVGGFGGATTPALSPDGKRLAFVRRVKDKTVLTVYDMATRVQRPVYDALERDDQADFIAQGSYYPQYAWFPDNRSIAIWGKGKLYRIDTASGQASEIPFRANVRQQVTTPVRVAQELAPETMQVRILRQLAPLPDERSIVFAALGQLWNKKLPDGKPVRLTDAAALESEPRLSPDGKQLAYVTWADETGGTLSVVGPAGGTPRVLVRSRGVLREPAFSPDGTMLVYMVDEGDKCIGGYEARAGLYVVPAAGGDSRYVGKVGNGAQFSADGTRIYFTREEYKDHDKLNRLLSVNLQGQDERTHALTGNADTSELRLSPDGRWLAFRELQQYYVAPFRETGTPVAVSAAAAGATRLTDLGGYALTWSADSRKLFWALGPRLYRASVDAPAARAEPFAEAGLSVPVDRPQGPVAFTNGRIITMRGDEVIENGTLVVQGNRIAAVGPAGKVEVPADAKVIDIAGKTLMPGMVDMHGHIDQCYYSSAGLSPQKYAPRYAELAYGITTNYDPYTSELATYQASEMTRAGRMVGPRAIDSGMVAYGRRGKTDSTYLQIDGYADALAYMTRKQVLGGTIVKSYRQPMRSARQMLIKAGRETGVMTDVEGESGFYNNITMLLDGHTNLQHNMPIATYYDDLVQLFGRAGASNTPTLIVLFGELMGENYFYQKTRAWDDPKAQRFVSETTSGYSAIPTPYAAPPSVRGMTTIHAAEELWDIGFRSVARSMKKLDEAGAVISAGSHGQVPGLAMHWEMWLLAEGGMPNLRVLRTATLNGAKTLGLDQQIGSLEPGKLADLVVLDGNPLTDIRNTNTGRYTMVNGRLYDALSMNEIGRYDRPRGKFYWEMLPRGESWNSSWGHH